jgi:hypothetical protein
MGRTEEIRQREQAATKGPWEAHTREEWGYGTQAWIVPLSGGPSPGCHASDQHIRDNEFIAHAREDIPYLLALVERLEAAGKKVADFGISLHEAIDDSGILIEQAKPGMHAALREFFDALEADDGE